MKPNIVPLSKIKIVHKKLGREKALGQTYPDGDTDGVHVLEIDARQDSKEYLDTLIHETLHVIFPEMGESEVYKTANLLSKVVWRQNFRKVEV